MSRRAGSTLRCVWASVKGESTDTQSGAWKRQDCVNKEAAAQQRTNRKGLRAPDVCMYVCVWACVRSMWAPRVSISVWLIDWDVSQDKRSRPHSMATQRPGEGEARTNTHAHTHTQRHALGYLYWIQICLLLSWLCLLLGPKCCGGTGARFCAHWKTHVHSIYEP